MSRYILRRTLLAIPVVWGSVTLLFLAFFVVPGDPVELMAGGRAVTPTVRANVEADLGLDQPWHEQYGRYWGRLVQGDLGESYRTGRTVNTVVRETGAASLRLAFWAVLVEITVGVAAGVVAAAKRRSFLDSLATVSTTVMLAVPAFVLGYLLIYMLGVYTFEHGFPSWARFPVQGIGPDSWALGVVPTGNQWRYLVMPVVTLAAANAALVARLTRGSMLNVLKEDHVRTAAATGLPPRAILRRNLKSCMIPLVTLIGLDLANVIGAAIVTETVFNWPGLGSTIASAVSFLDAPIVLGLSIVLVLAYVLVNLAVDLSYAFLDPRIRLETRAR